MKLSFRSKTIIGVGLIEALLLSFLVWSSLQFLHDTNAEEINKRAQTTATLFATTTKDAVLSSDLATLESFVGSLLQTPDLLYVRILDERGHILAEQGKPDFLTKPFQRDQSLDAVSDGVFDATAPISEGGIPFGRVELGLDVAPFNAAATEARRHTLAIALSEMLLVAIFSALLGFYLTRQLKRLREGAHNIADKKFGHVIPVTGNDELADTARAFNAMSAELADYRQKQQQAEAEIVKLNRELKHRITQRTQQLEAATHKLQHISVTDPVTGLPNRRQFDEQLEALLSEDTAQHTGKNEKSFALVYIHLLDAIGLSRALGLQAYDSLLMEFVRRAQHSLRDKELLARTGEDHFALLMELGFDDSVLERMEWLKNNLKPPCIVRDQSIELRANIGIALYPTHAESATELFVKAQRAATQARNNGHLYGLYDVHQEGEHAELPVFLPRDLPNAIYDDQLCLHYQPKVNLATQTINSVEALIRWRHPEHGLLRPDLFIPVAEQNGMIKELTLWVLDKALAQCSAWLEQGHHLQVAINLSASFLHHEDLPHEVDRLLCHWQIPASYLMLEVTENAMITDPPRALGVIRQLHNLGLKVSIDDFGTGFSSLSYLKQLKADELKIDRVFVRNIERDRDNQTIVRSTIEMAHNLGLSVVAEGVESEAAIHLLHEMHCDVIQGFVLSRPVPAEEIADLEAYPLNTLTHGGQTSPAQDLPKEASTR